MKFFKRHDDDNSFSITDEFGEWLILRKNRNASIIRAMIEKTMKKLKVKDWDFSLLYYVEDEKIKGLFSTKGMLTFPDHIRELDFYNAFKTVSSDYLTLGEMRLSRLRACNITFLFFSADLLVRKSPKIEEEQIKMLLPPRGAYGYEIPYVMKDLFIKMIERTLESSCSSASLTLNNGSFESVYQCRSSKEINVESLKETFSYFSYEEPKVSLKTTSPRVVEIQVSISKFRTKYLIPLLWGNILASNIVC
ncbi:hypothetical protein SJAV_23190 [Sulfurisphaera javensis]|uniref:Uncharacterized protein n=2 Tax=Sulfurisphaera javensis TaxID=2049879 RepID=A0AAT9GU05_9CREN